MNLAALAVTGLETAEGFFGRLWPGIFLLGFRRPRQQVTIGHQQSKIVDRLMNSKVDAIQEGVPLA